MNPVRIGIIGAGGIAQAYAQACDTSQLARLTAVADVRPEAAAALADGRGARAFASHTAMLEAGVVDAVIVSTPPNLHPAITCECLDRGFPVLCEKPLAIDVEGAARMLAAHRRTGVILTMGSKFRYVRDVITARSLVTSGILGEISMFENSFTAHVDMTRRWNSNAAVSGGGVLIDNGTHSVDIMHYFLGPLQSVLAIEGPRTQGLNVDETVHVFVRSAAGVIGSIDLSWSINKQLDSFISVYGTKGTVHVGWKQSRYRQSSSPEWIVFGQGYDKIAAFRAQLDNFAGAIRGTDRLLINAEDGLASVEVVASIYDSLRSAQWASVQRTGLGELRNPGASGGIGSVR